MKGEEGESRTTDMLKVNVTVFKECRSVHFPIVTKEKQW